MRAPFLGFLALVTMTGVAGAASAQPGELQAGQWELTITTKMTGIPGMSAARNQSRTVRHCLTPEGARNGGRDLLISKGCSIKRYTVAHGRIDADTVCGPAGHAMTSRTTGSYTATTLHTTSHTAMDGPAPMTIDMEGTGHRIGACPAGQ